jgi:hypothetical protein
METHIGPLSYAVIGILVFAVIFVLAAVIAGILIKSCRGRSAGLVLGILSAPSVGVVVGNALDEPDQLGPPVIGFFVILFVCPIIGYTIGRLIDRKRPHGRDL